MHNKHYDQPSSFRKLSFISQNHQTLEIGPKHTGTEHKIIETVPKRHHILIIVFSVSAGLINAFSLLGWASINPISTNWIRGDSATHYLGWAFFRQGEIHTFPMTWTTQLGYPYGVSISFLDSIPLISIILHPFSNILPNDFQYLGIYTVISMIMMCYFGTKIIFLISKGDTLTSCIGGILIMLSPAFTWRLIDHFALSSHWILLSSLYYYFSLNSASKTRKWFLSSSFIMFIAGGVNPYISALTILIFLSSCLKMYLVTSTSKSKSIALGLFGTLCTITSLTTFGFLFTGDGTEYSGMGYGYYSLNLIAPIDPQNFHSLLFRQQPLALGGQYEGYNYLGLGVILIFIVSLSKRWEIIKQLGRPDLFPLLLLATVTTIAACSTVVTLGPWIIADITLPSAVESVVSAFRASGRLFWPTYYLLIIAAVWMALIAFRPAMRVPLLTLAVLIQTVDIGSLRAYVHDTKLANSTRPILDFSGAPGRSRGGTAVLSDPEWAQLSNMHRHLVLLPAWQCDRQKSPGGYNAFGRLAVSQHLTMNSYYAGRYGQKEKEIHCIDLPNQILSGHLDRHSVYILSNEFAREALLHDISSHYCSLLEGFITCRIKNDLSGLSPDLYERLYQAFPMGKQVSMSKSESGYRFFGSGWSHPEQWGTWMVGEKAVIVLRRAAATKQDLLLTATINAFVNSRHPHQEIEVLINGNVIARWSFHAKAAGDSTSNPRVEQIVIPGSTVTQRELLKITFRARNATSPADLGISGDERRLGLGLHSVLLSDLSHTR